LSRVSLIEGRIEQKGAQRSSLVRNMPTLLTGDESFDYEVSLPFKAF
jgi:hypothetical protein